MNRRAWILFALVAVLWGIPYLLIKIAIEDLSPLLVVFGRVAIAALVLVPVATAQGTLSSLRRNLGPLTFLGLVHIVGPFLLITYGEVHISSSLTGLLIAIEPVLIALLMLRAEPLTRVRGAGLALGLVGVAVLVGLDISGDRLGLLGAGMVLLATLLYAVATVYVQRRAADVPPTALVAGTTTVSTVVLAPFAAFSLPTMTVSGGSWAALLALGLLCTAVALLAFYRLIGEAGPARAGLVTYANPVVAVLLGVAILDEPLHASTIFGFLLIVAGCWLSTRPTRTATPEPTPQPARPVELATASR
ncbi:DMT family transporter [Asanoa sp. NPDC049518]|uniref:DMT family transporter n=1 Tax=unclassified Asanoa TaxID=2685164 RepID=UPI0034491EF4